jgi:hypothetical protein
MNISIDNFRNNSSRAFSLVFFLTTFISLISGQTTIGTENPKDKPSTAKHKVLILPFGDKMYRSDIDQSIAKEKKLNQKEIRFVFQDAVDDWLYKKISARFEVVSLFADTAKFKKDLTLLYSGLGYSYDKVPSQTKYVAPVSDYERNSQIKNGNIQTEVNSEARFMNAKILKKDLLSTLNKKHGTDVFVFINELDLLSNAGSTNEFGQPSNRTAVLHYTCFNLLGEQINSGTVNVKFPSNLNDPSKIMSSYLSSALEVISVRLENGLKEIKASKTTK